jgi:hypothetical protein
MKKILVILVFVLATCSYSFGQELGVRFGDVTAGHVAVDAMFSAGKFSKIHADVSFGSGVGVDALWDFLYKPLGGEAINLYLGAGPYVWIDDPFWLGLAAEAGLEYRFNSVPIAIGADWRPRLSLIETTDFHWEGFGVNVRFIFGRK